MTMATQDRQQTSLEQHAGEATILSSDARAAGEGRATSQHDHRTRAGLIDQALIPATARALRLLVHGEHMMWSALQAFLLEALGHERRRAYNKTVYLLKRSYVADAERNVRGLWPWERECVERFFPPPPGRVLVGGCGGGREVWPLLELGYSVTAFDPERVFVDGLTRQLEARRVDAEVLCGGYEELFERDPALDVAWRSGPYSAVLLGWASFSYLLRPQDPFDLMSALRRLCPDGPVLLSYADRTFLGTDATGEATDGRWRRLAARVLRRSSADRSADERAALVFSPNSGIYRRVRRQDLEALAARAGYRVAHHGDPSVYPHAVLVPAGA